MIYVILGASKEVCFWREIYNVLVQSNGGRFLSNLCDKRIESVELEKDLRNQSIFRKKL